MMIYVWKESWAWPYKIGRSWSFWREEWDKQPSRGRADSGIKINGDAFPGALIGLQHSVKRKTDSSPRMWSKPDSGMIGILVTGNSKTNP